MSRPFNRGIRLGGEDRRVGTSVVTVLEENSDFQVTRAKGTTVPADGDAGFAFGCQFVDTDSSATYVNRGTAASALFLAESSIPSEVVTATNVLTAAESGKTFYLSALAGFLTTLPAPAAGLIFRFIVKTAPTSNGYTIGTSGGANVIFGMAVERAGGAGVAGSAEDLITLGANQSIPGDFVYLESDGTNWYAHAMVDVAAAITFTVT